jgi:hypothetical protein
MNQKQYQIAMSSRWSWTNMHNHRFVSCRKCEAPLRTTEFSNAVVDGKLIDTKLLERCSECPVARKKKEKEDEQQT